MIIRNAEQSDFDFIYKTWKENQKYGMSIPRKVRINERIEKKEMFILEDDGIIIGMFNLHTRKLPKSYEGWIELSCFAVKEEYKRKGYGTFCLNWIKEKYKTVIICDAHKGSRNNSFYERNGFVSYGEKIVGNTICVLYKLDNCQNMFGE